MQEPTYITAIRNRDREDWGVRPHPNQKAQPVAEVDRHSLSEYIDELHQRIEDLEHPADAVP